jgi:hypothetical protein
MLNAKIDIFEISHEKSLSYFKHLENLEKIRRTNSPNPSSLPEKIKKTVFVTSSVDKSSKNHKGSNMWCHYCDKSNHNKSNCRAFDKFKMQKKTRLDLNSNLYLERSLCISHSFSKKLMHSKGSCK